jgi:hypothetical protein
VDAEPGLLAEIAAAIHLFAQRNPNHYGSRALASVVNRLAEGENVPRDERELVLATLIRAVKDEERNRRSGRRGGD